MEKNKTKVIIAGAGPAGLAAAYTLSRQYGQPCMILEKNSVPGGLSKTVYWNGFRADIGGHRFFTKNDGVMKLWKDVLGEEFTPHKRISRIYYENIFFQYPLKPTEIPIKLGIIKSAKIAFSYFVRRLFPIKPENNFEDWVKNRFGEVLYEIFFKTYTEKIWGIHPSKISAEWSAQRIKALSLPKVIADTLGLSRKNKQTSLISEFHYPRYGPGQMYDKMAELIMDSGSEILYNSKLEEIHISKSTPLKVESVLVKDKTGKIKEIATDYLISSIPIDELIKSMSPEPDKKVVQAAQNLKYRSILTINLIYNARIPCKDNWIYLNSDNVKAGRVQFYHNWSEDMVPSPDMSCIGLEYFCDENDNLWNSSDEELYNLALKDSCNLEFLRGYDPSDFFIAKYPKAYPCYINDYKENLEIIKEFLSGIPNLISIGRYGQFRYNNMDHSIETGILAARSIQGEKINTWAVNEDAIYLEDSG